MRQTIQWLVVAIATTLPTLAVAQGQEDKPANPFEIQGDSGYGAMGTGYPGAGGGGSMGGVPMGEGYGGEAMGGYPGGGGMAGSPPDTFRAGLARLLDMLPRAKSDEEKQQLLEYAREALTKRYQQELERRESEIRNLQLRLAALRDEQQRRSDATERIIDLQMKSLELAAEGLLERDQVINVTPRRRNSPYGGGMSMGYGGGGSSPYGGGGSPYGDPYGAGGGSPYGAGGYGEESYGEGAAPGGESTGDAQPSGAELESDAEEQADAATADADEVQR